MFFPVSNRKSLSQSRQCNELHLIWHLLLNAALCSKGVWCFLSSGLYQSKSDSSYLVSKRLPKPQIIFLPAPKPSIISNHFPTLFRHEPTPLLFPHPCLKAWLTRIHAALRITVNNKGIFTLCPSTCRTPSASEFPWFQCLPTGLIKVNHLWQTAFLHQMEQAIHCQSNRTRVLQRQLLSNRNSL